MRQYADSFTDTGHSATTRLAYIFEREKLLIRANQVDLLYKVKNDISKIVAFIGVIF
jgi:hypothetical protein